MFPFHSLFLLLVFLSLGCLPHREEEHPLTDENQITGDIVFPTSSSDLLPSLRGDLTQHGDLSVNHLALWINGHLGTIEPPRGDTRIFPFHALLPHAPFYEIKILNPRKGVLLKGYYPPETSLIRVDLTSTLQSLGFERVFPLFNLTDFIQWRANLDEELLRLAIHQGNVLFQDSLIFESPLGIMEGNNLIPILEFVKQNPVTASAPVPIPQQPPSIPPSTTIPPGNPPSANLKINDGSAITHSLEVTLNLFDVIGSGTIEMSLDGVNFEPFHPAKKISLTKGDGEKTVSLYLRDGTGKISDPIRDTIILEYWGPFTTVFSDDFETANPWGIFEEIVGGSPCYASGTGEVAHFTGLAKSGTTSLRVFPNKNNIGKSNHVIGQKKLTSSGKLGIYKYSFSAFIATDTATTGQTGPEFSLQNTRLIDTNTYRTHIVGLQYHVTPWSNPPGKWSIWSESSPGIAEWKSLTALPIASGTWYRISLEVDFTRNRYLNWSIQGPNLDFRQNLENWKIVPEIKFFEDAFWLSLEGENLWNNCGTQSFQYKIHYDDVVLERRED